MRHSKADPAESLSTEERLRQEIEDLKRQLHGQRSPHSPSKLWHPSALTIWALLLLLTVAIVGAFFAGYIPLKKRNALIVSEAREQQQALPRVEVIQVGRSSSKSELLLPGNIQAVTEAPILARADGYIKRRLVDIGDRVKAGQTVAEIEAPELDQQVSQARAAVEQGQATLSRTQHVLAQSVANLDLAEVTVKRWKALVDRGVVSKQEYDQQNANYEAQRAAMESARSDVRAAEDSIRGSQHNLERLINLQSYKKIVAPFSGIITARNVDIGALINSNGTTPIFRIAQIDVVRIMVDVPQRNAPFIKVGEPAQVTLQEFPGRKFTGKVSRTANALEANTRTLPTEVQVPNPNGALMPNMFAQVNLVSAQVLPGILIPGDALIVRSNGTQVAVIESGNRVHLQPVELGRDYGAELEVRSGLSPGQYVIVNPSDDAREGAEVHPIQAKPAQPRKR